MDFNDDGHILKKVLEQDVRVPRQFSDQSVLRDARARHRSKRIVELLSISMIARINNESIAWRINKSQCTSIKR